VREQPAAQEPVDVEPEPPVEIEPAAELTKRLSPAESRAADLPPEDEPFLASPETSGASKEEPTAQFDGLELPPIAEPVSVEPQPDDELDLAELGLADLEEDAEEAAEPESLEIEEDDGDSAAVSDDEFDEFLKGLG